MHNEMTIELDNKAPWCTNSCLQADIPGSRAKN